MNIAKKLTKIVADSAEPLDAYTIAMMYWENEKYMWPTTEWHLHEPKKEEFSGTFNPQSDHARMHQGSSGYMILG